MRIERLPFTAGWRKESTVFSEKSTGEAVCRIEWTPWTAESKTPGKVMSGMLRWV